MSKDTKLYINIMAFVILIAAVLLLSSCEKQEIAKEDCNCGTITEEKKLQSIPFNNWYYTMDIKNNCTGNTKEFDSSFQVWSDYNVGDNYCRGSQW